MFTSAKDIMKIIWNGLREIKKNCSDYYEKDARKIYEETLDGVKAELSGPEPEEKRKYEVAEELGLLDKVMESGWRSLTSKETGRIGGLVTKKRRKEKEK